MHYKGNGDGLEKTEKARRHNRKLNTQQESVGTRRRGRPRKTWNSTVRQGTLKVGKTRDEMKASNVKGKGRKRFIDVLYSNSDRNGMLSMEPWAVAKKLNASVAGSPVPVQAPSR